MAFQLRHRWIIQRISEAFHLEQLQVEEFLRQEANFRQMSDLLSADGTPKLLVFHQPRDARGEVRAHMLVWRPRAMAHCGVPMRARHRPRSGAPRRRGRRCCFSQTASR